MVLLFVRDETIIPLEEKTVPSFRKFFKFQEDLLSFFGLTIIPFTLHHDFGFYRFDKCCTLQLSQFLISMTAVEFHFIQ